MNNLRGFKQKLASVSRRREEKNFDSALAEVGAMLEAWPGNGHLHVLWARLVQLQDEPGPSLEQAKEALQQAVELDKTSPVATIELGHFLDAVEDNPQAASKVPRPPDSCSSKRWSARRRVCSNWKNGRTPGAAFWKCSN